MFKSLFANAAKGFANYCIAHEQEIFAGFGIALGLVGTCKAVSEAPKVAKDIDNKKEELGRDLTMGETVVTAGKRYLPAIVTIGAGVVCVVESVSVGKKRYSALAVSYELLKEASETYKQKVIETIGENKEKKIEAAIAQDNVDKNPPKAETIYITEKGQTLFKDSLTGQYFRSDVNTVRRCALELANQELCDNYAGVPEWLLSLGLEVPDSMLGQGWSAPDQGRLVTIDFTPVTAHKYNDEPCHTITYDPMPVDDYYYQYSR